MMLRQLYSKGLHMMVAQPRQVRLFSHMLKLQNQYLNNQIAMITVNQVSHPAAFRPIFQTFDDSLNIFSLYREHLEVRERRRRRRLRVRSLTMRMPLMWSKSQLLRSRRLLRLLSRTSRALLRSHRKSLRSSLVLSALAQSTR